MSDGKTESETERSIDASGVTVHRSYISEWARAVPSINAVPVLM